MSKVYVVENAVEGPGFVQGDGPADAALRYVWDVMPPQFKPPDRKEWMIRLRADGDEKRSVVSVTRGTDPDTWSAVVILA